METNHAACLAAITHLNAAIDALLAPMRGPDGNCRRPETVFEHSVMTAYRALDDIRERHLYSLECLARGS